MHKIRAIKPGEYPFLWDMLFEAVFVPEGKQAPARSVVEPYVARYLEDFGREGDLALVLDTGDELVGAIWARQFSEPHQGYGFVDAQTPELGMAIKEPYRGQGSGTRMIGQMCAALAQNGLKQVSLSVDKLNPAFRLYQRCGFTIVSDLGKGYTMVKKL
jgi:ribosomal-protein-alanine N-acetyltransferase